MTVAEYKKKAKKFVKLVEGWTEEEQYKQKFWTNLVGGVFGETDINYMEFEKPVYDVLTNTTKFIDVYIPSTKVIVEHKSAGKDLDEAFRQAFNYNNNLPADKKVNWIVVSDFARIIVYDMSTSGFPSIEIRTTNLEKDYDKLLFLVDNTIVDLPNREFEVSKKAGEIIGEIYNAIFDKYPDAIPEEERLQNLNKLCVRLVFCFYAEDAGLFNEKNQFHNYMKQYPAKDWRMRLKQLFKVLNLPKDDVERLYLDDDLKAFPYVNGGLFSDEVEMPQFTDETVDLILNTASGDFDWSEISPTIFGAMFESTLNQETRRQGGMHYTSIENIHKVIDPLFLDDLKARLEEIKTFSVSQRTRALKEYQDYLASLKFLDPACGSGNFLTEAYICIRKLENEVLAILQNDQIVLDDFADVKVSINQFYGIEINDFAVSVAMTALWIAESQMFEESQKILHGNKEFLPLTTNTNIHEGTALRLDWNEIVPKDDLNYIMGNPPFVGQQLRTVQQSEEMNLVFADNPQSGHLDFVTCWYKLACDYIRDTNIKCAFVSTNSICQGEQVPILWSYLFEKYSIEINFAYKTFIWDSDTKAKAAVHCVIIGFSNIKTEKYLFEQSKKKNVSNINGYLIDAPHITLDVRTNTPPKGYPKLIKGSQPTDDGNFFVSKEEMSNQIKKDSNIKCCFRPFVGAKEFLNSITQDKYCIWLKDVPPHIYMNNAFICTRLDTIKQFRSQSKNEQTRDCAKTPHLFTQIRQPDSDFIVIPRVSSENRLYIPMAYYSKDYVAGDTTIMLPNANHFIFGILQSNVHTAWVRTVAGRLKSDYRYSPAVYNNFPWCVPTDEQRAKIEKTAQAILDARNNHPECSLADMYGGNMYLFTDLVKAHEENDKAVWEAYGKAWEFGNESECVAHLMKLYEQKVQEVK